MLGLLGLSLLGLGACGGGGGGSDFSAGALTASFSITNGFGDPILPLRIRRPDAQGNPTAAIVEIRDLQTLIDNKPSQNNPVLPVARWPLAAVLPNQQPGNHYVLIQFGNGFIPSETSILNPSAANGLTGALTVSALDPATGIEETIKGRLFVAGRTADNGAIQTWLTHSGAVASTLSDERKAQLQAGYPGLAAPFSGSKGLFGARSVVFIPDADDDLSTFEAFPTSRNIRVTVGTGTKAKSGAFWPAEAVGVSTVGADTLPPEVAVNPGPLTPKIEPPLNASLVPINKRVEIQFTEPVQPFAVGPLPSKQPAPVTGGARLSFQVGQNTVALPFDVLPSNALNFTKMILTPEFQLPGSYFVNGPGGLPTPQDVVFSVTVDLTNVGQIFDLSLLANTIPRTSVFSTGPGTGIVNAPVAPSAVYIGFGGQSPGVGVLDLDGFGQGTGTPTQDNLATLPIEANTTNFPNNPDINQAIAPPLVVESTPLAGGSLGPLTLARDSSTVNFVFAQAPAVNGVRDMQIGQPLDILFNNGVCLSGGGNFCAKDSFHFQSGNNITINPAPNPPKLAFPPLCLSPFIWGTEPISARNAGGSLLKPGNFLGSKATGIPPQGLFTDAAAPYTVPPSYAPTITGPGWPGPDFPPTQPPFVCVTYTVRQQIGHFLYVIDPVVRRVVALNSNRMTVVDSIPQPDPVNLAMTSDLKILAVSNFSTNQVQYIDIEPLSVSFHTVVGSTNVGGGPLGIAAQPDNEDLFVCCSESNRLDIINTADFKVRKSVSNQLQKPFDVAVTSRQLNFGFNTGVYFAYVLNQNGSVAIFESGPSGLQGYGFDDLIGLTSSTFSQPTAIQPDTNNLSSGVWIVHRTSTGLPTASNLAMTSSPVGPIPFNQFIIFPSPSFRNREFTVVQTIQPAQLTGNVQDLAFDDTNNNGMLGIPLFLSGGFGTPGAFVPHSAKRHIRIHPVTQAIIPVAIPKAIFFTSFDSGSIDVIDRVTGLRLVEPVVAPGAQRLTNYFRQ